MRVDIEKLKIHIRELKNLNSDIDSIAHSVIQPTESEIRRYKSGNENYELRAQIYRLEQILHDYRRIASQSVYICKSLEKKSTFAVDEYYRSEQIDVNFGNMLGNLNMGTPAHQPTGKSLGSFNDTLKQYKDDFSLSNNATNAKNIPVSSKADPNEIEKAWGWLKLTMDAMWKQVNAWPVFKNDKKVLKEYGTLNYEKMLLNHQNQINQINALEALKEQLKGKDLVSIWELTPEQRDLLAKAFPEINEKTISANIPIDPFVQGELAQKNKELEENLKKSERDRQLFEAIQIYMTKHDGAEGSKSAYNKIDVALLTYMIKNIKNEIVQQEIQEAKRLEEKAKLILAMQTDYVKFIEKGKKGEYYKEYLEIEKNGTVFYGKTLFHGKEVIENYQMDRDGGQDVLLCRYLENAPAEVKKAEFYKIKELLKKDFSKMSLEEYINTMGPIWEIEEKYRTIDDDIRDVKLCITILSALAYPHAIAANGIRGVSAVAGLDMAADSIEVVDGAVHGDKAKMMTGLGFLLLPEIVEKIKYIRHLDDLPVNRVDDVPNKHIEDVGNSTANSIEGFKTDTFYEAMTSGAVDKILSKMSVEEFIRLEELAEKMYDGFRIADDDFVKIANKINFNADDLKAIKEHLFLKEHKFADGTIRKFDANYWQAEAWERVSKGKPIDSDFTLLKHELFELKYMQKHNVPYEVAHKKANELYNWSMEVFGE